MSKSIFLHLWLNYQQKFHVESDAHLSLQRRAHIRLVTEPKARFTRNT